MYQALKLELITSTLETLNRRIRERFPHSGLARVGDELLAVAHDTEAILERFRRPNRVIRGAIALAVAVMIALAAALVLYLPALSLDVAGVGDLLQALESAAQDLIFLSLAMWFLLTLETRLNRRVSLQALRRLRSIVHIVDMHQLTKDPEHLLSPAMATPSSPERRLTRFELVRYLDYCSELLSISSKVAALHAQHLDDPVVLNAVNDIEVLASNLSSKIWQKIVILDTVQSVQPGRE